MNGVLKKRKVIEEVLREVKEFYGNFLTDERIIEIFEETAGEYLEKIFKREVDVFLDERSFEVKIYVHGDIEVKRKGLEDLSAALVRKLVRIYAQRIKEHFEREYVWYLYRVVKRRVKDVVKGRVVKRGDEGYWVEFEVFGEDVAEAGRLRLLGMCLWKDATYSDYDRLKAGKEYYFMIKDCYVKDEGGVWRLVVELSRRSKTFIKRLFELFGVPGDLILRVERKPYRVLVRAKERIPVHVIRKVSGEIMESVRVRY